MAALAAAQLLVAEGETALSARLAGGSEALLGEIPTIDWQRIGEQRRWAEVRDKVPADTSALAVADAADILKAVALGD